jgi:hypothetical protein
VYIWIVLFIWPYFEPVRPPFLGELPCPAFAVGFFSILPR